MTTLIVTTWKSSNPNNPEHIAVTDYDTYAEAVDTAEKVASLIGGHPTHNGGSTETRTVQWYQSSTHQYRFVIE